MDVNGILNMGQGLVDQVIRTFGTTVEVIDRDTSTDPDSLIQEEESARIYAGPAIVVAASNQTGVTDVLPGYSIRLGTWIVTMLPKVPDIPAGAVLRVTKCRDRALVGAEGKVVAFVRDSSGVVARVYVEPDFLGR